MSDMLISKKAIQDMTQHTIAALQECVTHGNVDTARSHIQAVLGILDLHHTEVDFDRPVFIRENRSPFKVVHHTQKHVVGYPDNALNPVIYTMQTAMKLLTN